MELNVLFDRHIALAGDREYGEDDALVGGFAWVGERRCVFIAGAGVPSHPAAYGKATRMARLAEQTGAPLVLLGTAASLHLLPPGDPRATGAFNVYMAALAGGGATRVAVTAGSGDEGLREAFDAVVDVGDLDGATGVDVARAKLAAALNDYRGGNPTNAPVARPDGVQGTALS